MSFVLGDLASIDPARWGAIVLALVFVSGLFTPRLHEALGGTLRVDGDTRHERRHLAVLAFVAASLSLGYVAYYLRGGPRSIDATAYFLEGRALSEGQFAWDLPTPSASFRGRFLVHGDPNHLGVLFPPGYPLLLSFGFVLGTPLVIGPLLAAALVVVTYLLAKELARTLGASRPEGFVVARTAALLSVFSLALRYHTADTMSHAASALGIATMLLALLTARREKNGAFVVLGGFAAGYVAATRPVSAIVPLVLGAVLSYDFQTGDDAPPPKPWERKWGLLRFALGTLPFIGFLLASQKSLVGELFRSTQAAYYAASDGPPGCFRLGFGGDVGCHLEHGDFIAKYMPQGFGPVEALRATLRRLGLHLGDATSSEGVTFVLLAAGLLVAKRSRALRFTAALVIGHVIAYAFFYFDGNYPGAGGRLLADVIPLEHALGACGLSFFFTTLRSPSRSYLALALSLASFAAYGHASHRALADAQGGLPMFEPMRLHDVGVKNGLLYFDTDHGFDLAYAPGTDPKVDVLAVRERKDDRDRLVYELFGKPIARRYVFDRTGKDAPHLDLFVPPVPRGAYRFEAENEWPPFSQDGALAERVAHPPASNGEWLRITPYRSEGRITIDLPVLPSGAFSVKPQLGLLGAHAKGRISVLEGDGATRVTEWVFVDDGPAGGLRALEARTVRISTPRARLEVVAEGGAVALDAFFVEDEHPH